MSTGVMPLEREEQMYDDAFGYWLSGFTDGEGCFLLLLEIFAIIASELLVVIHRDFALAETFYTNRVKMRAADMECKVVFLSFHFPLFPKFFISFVTSHEPICSSRNLWQKTRGGNDFLPRVFLSYRSGRALRTRFCSPCHII